MDDLRRIQNNTPNQEQGIEFLNSNAQLNQQHGTAASSSNVSPSEFMSEHISPSGQTINTGSTEIATAAPVPIGYNKSTIDEPQLRKAFSEININKNNAKTNFSTPINNNEHSNAGSSKPFQFFGISSETHKDGSIYLPTQIYNNKHFVKPEMHRNSPQNNIFERDAYGYRTNIPQYQIAESGVRSLDNVQFPMSTPQFNKNVSTANFTQGCSLQMANPQLNNAERNVEYVNRFEPPWSAPQFNFGTRTTVPQCQIYDNRARSVAAEDSRFLMVNPQINNLEKPLELENRFKLPLNSPHDRTTVPQRQIDYNNVRSIDNVPFPMVTPQFNRNVSTFSPAHATNLLMVKPQNTNTERNMDSGNWLEPTLNFSNINIGGLDGPGLRTTVLQQQFNENSARSLDNVQLPMTSPQFNRNASILSPALALSPLIHTAENKVESENRFEPPWSAPQNNLGAPTTFPQHQIDIGDARFVDNVHFPMATSQLNKNVSNLSPTHASKVLMVRPQINNTVRNVQSENPFGPTLNASQINIDEFSDPRYRFTAPQQIIGGNAQSENRFGPPLNASQINIGEFGDPRSRFTAPQQINGGNAQSENRFGPPLNASQINIGEFGHPRSRFTSPQQINGGNVQLENRYGPPLNASQINIGEFGNPRSRFTSPQQINGGNVQFPSATPQFNRNVNTSVRTDTCRLHMPKLRSNYFGKNIESRNRLESFFNSSQNNHTQRDGFYLHTAPLGGTNKSYAGCVGNFRSPQPNIGQGRGRPIDGSNFEISSQTNINGQTITNEFVLSGNVPRNNNKLIAIAENKLVLGMKHPQNNETNNRVLVENQFRAIVGQYNGQNNIMPDSHFRMFSPQINGTEAHMGPNVSQAGNNEMYTGMGNARPRNDYQHFTFKSSYYKSGETIFSTTVTIDEQIIFRGFGTLYKWHTINQFWIPQGRGELTLSVIYCNHQNYCRLLMHHFYDISNPLINQLINENLKLKEMLINNEKCLVWSAFDVGQENTYAVHFDFEFAATTFKNIINF